MEHRSDNDPKKLGKGTGRVKNERTTRDHLSYSIVMNDKNTEESSIELRRLARNEGVTPHSAGWDC